MVGTIFINPNGFNYIESEILLTISFSDGVYTFVDLNNKKNSCLLSEGGIKSEGLQPLVDVFPDVEISINENNMLDVYIKWPRPNNKFDMVHY